MTPISISDAVFGVKKSLLVEFRKIDDPEAAAKVELSAPFYDVEFDFVLSRKKALSLCSCRRDFLRTRRPQISRPRWRSQSQWAGGNSLIAILIKPAWLPLG